MEHGVVNFTTSVQIFQRKIYIYISYFLKKLMVKFATRMHFIQPLQVLLPVNIYFGGVFFYEYLEFRVLNLIVILRQD